MKGNPADFLEASARSSLNHGTQITRQFSSLVACSSAQHQNAWQIHFPLCKLRFALLSLEDPPIHPSGQVSSWCLEGIFGTIWYY